MPFIANTIKLNRYFKFRSNLHVVSQCNPITENNDRPVNETLRKRCSAVPLEEYNNNDQQMIPFTGIITIH